MLYFRAFKTVFIIHHDRYQYQYHRGERSLRYFDPISATAVIGANALSEIGASFVAFASQIPSGFFGGRSRNYENKLQELYKNVVESLKQNARSYRADAVIGFSVNIDEISGKGTQMFMITYRYTSIAQ